MTVILYIFQIISPVSPWQEQRQECAREVFSDQ